MYVSKCIKFPIFWHLSCVTFSPSHNNAAQQTTTESQCRTETSTYFLLMTLQTSWVALYITKWVGRLCSLSPSPSAGIFSRQCHLVLNVLFMVMTSVSTSPLTQMLVGCVLDMNIRLARGNHIAQPEVRGQKDTGSTERDVMKSKFSRYEPDLSQAVSIPHYRKHCHEHSYIFICWFF